MGGWWWWGGIYLHSSQTKYVGTGELGNVGVEPLWKSTNGAALALLGEEEESFSNRFERDRHDKELSFDFLSICNDFHHVPHTVTIMRVICIEAKIILAVTLRFTTRMLEDLHRMLNSFHHYPNDDNDELYVLGIKQQGSDDKKNDE